MPRAISWLALLVPGILVGAVVTTASEPKRPRRPQAPGTPSTASGQRISVEPMGMPVTPA